ncbi:MAG: fatty acid desaturase [Pseudomonadota bacterium]|nr:fatty acid desaturase [Pseudomonadota bacterium]
MELPLSIGPDIDPTAIEARLWTQILNKYREPSHLRGFAELAVTALPLAGLWALAWLAYAHGYWWAALLIATLAAGFMLRLFIIQHDCGHGSFFPHKRLNDWVGRVLGIFTLTPYDFWRRTHAIHHATSGNLDRRGTGDIDTFTVREYLALSRFGRLKYRLYRNPVVLFVIGPTFHFAVKHRLPFGLMRNGWEPWISTMATNVGIAIFATGAVWLMGLKGFLIVHAPVVMGAASIGVWLFFVQHQFESTAWSDGQNWNLHETALHGSSHYDLPGPLRWFTGNIGIHHVHHLHSRIPFYRLPQVIRDYPQLGEVGRLTLLESLRCARLVLWDEDRQRLVTFKDAVQPDRPPAASAGKS